MQLFTVGLHKLNMDGTPILDSNGAKIPTYDNDDIMTFARAWTAFDQEPFRSNIEIDPFANIGRSKNWIDPMQIKAVHRDMFPKLDTLDGYIGDRVPLCSDLPSRSFLRAGAVYEYVGAAITDNSYIQLGLIGGDASTSSSNLYEAICQSNSDGSCTHPVEVVLDENVPCDGVECDVDTVRNVKLVWNVNGVESSVFYRYKPAVCAKLAFFEGQQASDKYGQKLCAHKDTLLAGAGCCVPDETNRLIGTCKYQSEHITYSTLEARCAAESKVVCGPYKKLVTNGCEIGGRLNYGWITETCSVKAQVDSRGFVSIVHSANSGEGYLNPNTKYAFQVPWKNGAFPKVSDGCGGGCVIEGGTCLCNVTISETAAHIDTSAMPSQAELEALLPIGSASPQQFDSGVYSKCTTAVCTSVSGVEAYFKSGGNSFNQDTIFKITNTRGTTYLANKISTVDLNETYQFRNPPHLMTFSEPTTSEVEHETEKVIDHFFEHPNTGKSSYAHISTFDLFICSHCVHMLALCISHPS